MNLLIFGSDSATHALAWKLINSASVQELIVAPGNAGTAFFAPAVALDPHDHAAITNFVLSEAINLVVLDGAAITAGVADEVRVLPLPVCGADKAVQQLQASRCAAREWLQQHTLPTPRSRVCTSQAQAEKYAATLPHPLVVAADAPAGPVIICQDRAAVPGAIAECLAGATAILVEEWVRGPRVTAAILTDGHSALPVPPTRLFTVDPQPYAAVNGVHSAATPLWSKLDAVLQRDVRAPLLTALTTSSLGARGWISARCVAGPRGPVIQAIDPAPSGFEAAAVLLRLESDLLPLLDACARGAVAALEPPRWRADASVGVGLLTSGAGTTLPPLDAFEGGVLVFHHATTPTLPNEYVPRLARFPSNRAPRFPFGLGGGLTALPDRPVEALTAIVATTAPDLNAARDRLYTSLRRSPLDPALYRADVGATEL